MVDLIFQLSSWTSLWSDSCDDSREIPQMTMLQHTSRPSLALDTEYFFTQIPQRPTQTPTTIWETLEAYLYINPKYDLSQSVQKL